MVLPTYRLPQLLQTESLEYQARIHPLRGRVSKLGRPKLSVQLKPNGLGEFSPVSVKAIKPSSSAAATCNKLAVRLPSLAVAWRDSWLARSKTGSGSPRRWKRPFRRSFSKSLNDDLAWAAVTSFRSTPVPKALTTSSSPSVVSGEITARIC